MNRGPFLVKISCLVGFLLFATFSAYFTASSLSLNLLNGTNLWLIFVLVLVIAILASYCLTNVIEELQNRVRASRSRFIFNLIGFLVFWTFSFVTNVHYFFVEKHGYTILTKELASAKGFIVDNTLKSNNAIDEQKYIAMRAVEAQVTTNLETFQREINNTMENHQGFGEACVNILNSTEVILSSDSRIYNDLNEYEIFDDVRDAGDVGITQRSRFNELYTKYSARILTELNKKLTVIEDYYERMKIHNSELEDVLLTINNLESVHLPAVLKDGTINAYYKYYELQNGEVISKMPEEYNNSCVNREGKEIVDFNVYPSERMFDTISVWSDILKGSLADMTMLQWIIIALIFDIVSFILFSIFRKQQD